MQAYLYYHQLLLSLHKIKKEKSMSTLELEAQKADLARKILCMDDESAINNIWLILKGFSSSVNFQKKPQKREIGFLEGKAKVVFHDDWRMTPEELGMV